MKTLIRRKVNALVESYGIAGTVLIVTATIALLPVPVPGTSFVPLVIAKGIKKILGY